MTINDALARFNRDAARDAERGTEHAALPERIRRQAEQARELLDNALELSNPRCARTDYIAALHSLRHFTSEALAEIEHTVSPRPPAGSEKI